MSGKKIYILIFIFLFFFICFVRFENHHASASNSLGFHKNDVPIIDDTVKLKSVMFWIVEDKLKEDLLNNRGKVSNFTVE